MIIYLDTETTGLDEFSEIVEIGIIDSQGEILYESFVKPLKRLSAESINIHGITNEMLTEAPSWADIHEDVNQIIKQADSVYIYNADYDDRLLKQTASLYNMQLDNYNSHCLMLEYAHMYGEFNHRTNLFDKWQRLTNAALQQNIDISHLKAHRAVSDCEISRLVKIAMRSPNFIKCAE